MIYFTSDTHIDHYNILTPSYDDRPFKDLSHMREELVSRHNEVVDPDDIVYHLGDLSMKHESVPYYLQRLHGVHILCAGNHDRCFRQEKYIEVYKEYGFAEVHVEPIKVYFEELGQEVLLSHLPYKGDPAEKYHDKRPENQGLWHICGHVHTSWKVKGKEINVGVMQWDYYPVSIPQIKEIVNDLGNN